MSDLMNRINDLNYRLGGGSLFQWVCDFTFLALLGVIGFMLIDPMEHPAVVANYVLITIVRVSDVPVRWLSLSGELLADIENKDKPKRGIIRKAAGGLACSFIGRLPQQLSEQRARLGGLLGDLISRKRTSTPVSGLTDAELRNLHKGSRIYAVVIGALLLCLSAYLKYPDIRSLMVLFGLVLYVMARIHREHVDLTSDLPGFSRAIVCDTLQPS